MHLFRFEGGGEGCLGSHVVLVVVRTIEWDGMGSWYDDKGVCANVCGVRCEVNAGFVCLVCGEACFKRQARSSMLSYPGGEPHLRPSDFHLEQPRP